MARSIEQSTRIESPPNFSNVRIVKTSEIEGFRKLARDPIFCQSALYAYALSHPTHDEYLCVIDRPLHQDELMHFIDKIAPISTKSITGVLDDWLGMDLDLMQAHAHNLGEHWEAFMQHLPLFTNTLEYGVSSFEKIYTYDYLKKKTLNSTFVLENLTYDNVGNDWNLWREQYKRFINTDDEVRRVPVNIHKDLLQLKRFFKTLKTADKASFLITHARYFSSFFHHALPLILERDGKSVQTTDSTIEVLTKPNGYNTQIQIGQLFEGNYYLKSADYGYYWQLIGDGAQWLGNFMLPVIHWTKENGRRTIKSNPFQTENQEVRAILSQWLIYYAAQTGHKLNHGRLNSFLGMMMLALGDEEFPKTWEKNQPYRSGAQKRQLMGPAQVPVVAAQKKTQLETSKALRSIEKLFS